MYFLRIIFVKINLFFFKKKLCPLLNFVFSFCLFWTRSKCFFPLDWPADTANCAADSTRRKRNKDETKRKHKKPKEKKLSTLFFFDFIYMFDLIYVNFVNKICFSFCFAFCSLLSIRSPPGPESRNMYKSDLFYSLKADFCI